ncbi:NAD synthetase [Thermotoga sp. Ku-13t]|uniref:NAD+ synthase n=1 Tax=Thermotoga sp. Ku-13t TaxID=1755813 RepID=UPI0013ECB5AE|nr:NAD+ synthase [Thermotoga sp. Ku-13t]KAF2958469.1 NAD synthetase [Thermotoga sp. Ku-13t]
MKRIRLTLAQLNPTLGDFEGNVRKAKDALDHAENMRSDLLLIPELFIPGYPPEDLAFRLSFLRANRQALNDFAAYTTGKNVVCVIGFMDFDEDVYNAAAVVHNGKIVAVYRKIFLPNYSVFDEKRYFRPGEKLLMLQFGSAKVGLTICEDIWSPVEPLATLVTGNGAQLIVNISASPYCVGKAKLRESYISMKAYEYHVAVAYCNMVGGQDELVFDGASFVCDASGELLARAKSFEEELLSVDVDLDENLRVNLSEPRRRYTHIENLSVQTVQFDEPEQKQDRLSPCVAELYQREQEIFMGLVTGLRDYVRKNGFEKVVIGLSGGMDSSLTAVIAVEALGRENVKGVLMPSMYTSKESMEDASILAKNLGIETLVLPINDVYDAYMKVLGSVFCGRERDITEENIQARIRGNYLMALSNKFGWLVLTTGNKSEIATGYCTLYGDTAGGFAVIKDVYKTDVYRIGRWYNRWKAREIIPERVFVKAPSAELRPGQTDQEKLPPYEVLDEILRLYVEEGLDVEEIVEKGHDPEIVERVLKMLHSSEYKRKQAPMGTKISMRAFGKDWRMPTTNKFRESVQR